MKISFQVKTNGKTRSTPIPSMPVASSDDLLTNSSDEISTSPTSPPSDSLRWLLLLMLIVFLAWLMWWLVLWYLPAKNLPDLSQHSNFGEMFGGINALFSALAFAGLIYTIILQRKELTLQRLELQLTRKELERQANALAAQNRGSTHERLYSENHVLLECFVNNPEIRPFFYENRPFEQCVDQAQRWQVLLIAEMYACFLELIALHLPELPITVRLEWRTFIQGAYQMSPALRNCIREHHTWYSQVLHDIIGEIPEATVTRLLETDMKPSLRLMTEFDLDALMDIQPEVYEKFFYEERNVLLNKLRLYSAGCWVCIVGSKVAGYLFSFPGEYSNPPALNSELDKLPESPNCYFVHDLAVRKAHQRNHIGSLLANKAIEIALEGRFQDISLIAVQQSSSFWSRHGFEAGNMSLELATKLSTYGKDATYMHKSLLNKS